MTLPLLTLLIACGQPAPPPPVPGEPATPASEVEPPHFELLPRVDHLPANALVFELHWSKAMRLGPHGVHVVDAAGEELPEAVRQVSWDAPVRVTAIQLATLAPSGPLHLILDGFISTDGGIGARVDHPFFVLPADHQGPDGAAVQVRGRPLPGTSEALTVRFPEPMSHRVLDSVTVLAGPAPAEGEWTLDDTQTVLHFTPAQPWPEAPVRVSIGAGAVDLAGNAIVDLPAGLLTPTVELEEPLPIALPAPGE